MLLRVVVEDHSRAESSTSAAYQYRLLIAVLIFCTGVFNYLGLVLIQYSMITEEWSPLKTVGILWDISTILSLQN